jgi:CRISPR-associated endonuclease/helicase Cas3
MRVLTADDFSEFFESVHNKPDTCESERKRAFDWQNRLAREILAKRRWPDVIHVPTACGKTSVLDIAVLELALQADVPQNQRVAARRICFVIDRRLVVDEVTDHAREMREAVVSAARGERDEPVLKAVAERLSALAVDPIDPLRVVRLRGGVYRDDGWAGDPLTPTILISTVDQIGSRLLFRGYGVSPRSRPVHAGLLAFDTRIILDEAHLSTVFGETLEGVRRFQEWAEQPPLPKNRRVSIVLMSATTADGLRPFELTPDERKDDKRLAPRLDASKPSELIEVEVDPITKDMRKTQSRKAREQEQKNRHKLVEELADHAKKVAHLDARDGDEQTKSPRVIGVVVNRVATARGVFEKLRWPCKDELQGDVLLLTGRIRPYDRDCLLKRWLPQIKAGRDKEPDRALFVVATQTVEVGANLDFDALVTEAASIDALRQRFGRLDRLGKRHERGAPAPAAILIRTDQKSKSDDDPVYGGAIARTWKWLDELSKKGSKKKGHPRLINFGINHLDPKLPKTCDQLRPMLAPQPQAPLLFPAHLDAWVQTNPMPGPNPDVAPFLHGQANSGTDVQVIWRADLKEEDGDAWADIVRLMPPRGREALSVPVYEARAWLRREAEADVADVEGAPMLEQRGRQDQGRRVLRWRGLDDAKVVGAGEIRPGDTIVVPATYGGADEYGWCPASKATVADVAEACLAQLIGSYPPNAYGRPTLRLRLHPSLFGDLYVDQPTKMHLKQVLSAALAVAKSEEADAWPVTDRVLRAINDHATDSAYRAAINALLRAARRRLQVYPRQDGVVVIAAVPVSLPGKQAPPREDVGFEEPEGDEVSLAPIGRQVLLTEHAEGVQKMATEFADQSGLRDELKQLLALAASWHDQGKCDLRFQAWLHGSELKALEALAANQALAKSGRDPKTNAGRFGYPRGSRHEFVSVRLFEQVHTARGDSSQLAKLLIGTHHGHGRPFPPIIISELAPIDVTMKHDGKPITTSSSHGLYQLDSGWVDLFWRMVRRYGWWGLAYLEALLITADRFVSAGEQQPQ